MEKNDQSKEDHGFRLCGGKATVTSGALKKPTGNNKDQTSVYDLAGDIVNKMYNK